MVYKMGMAIFGKRRILLIDDEREVSEEIIHELRDSGYDTAYAEGGEVGLRLVDEFEPHLIILDVQMPGMSGLEVLSELRKRQEYISVILASGASECEHVTRGLDEGADDYLKKPYQLRELMARIRCQLRILSLREELKAKNERLLKLASTDDLTGLSNMRVFFENFQKEIERANRSGQNIGILMIDMDNFKAINDRAGHVFGSKVLSKVGEIIRLSIRKTDVAARYGGDEFILLMTPITEDGLESVANNFAKRLSEDSIQKNPEQIKITTSIGGAIFNPLKESLSNEQMLSVADSALYEAKKLGRNKIHIINQSSMGTFTEAQTVI